MKVSADIENQLRDHPEIKEHVGAIQKLEVDWAKSMAEDDEDMLELALIENIQRANLNPIERARASIRSDRRAPTTTEAPAFASTRAVASPIPDDAPVITATRPSRTSVIPEERGRLGPPRSRRLAGYHGVRPR